MLGHYNINIKVKIMSYDAKIFKVFIASPGDVKPERTIIRDVLSEWNIVNSDPRRIVLLPVGWETHTSPSMDDQPQAIINEKILKECDLLVGVFWTRIGTSTEDYISGTVEEIEEHIKAKKPAMLYFSNRPVIPDSIDSSQYSKLKKFKESCKSRGIFETYEDLENFREKFYRQLQIKLNQDQYFSIEEFNNTKIKNISNSSKQSIPKLSKEAQSLLKESSKDSMGNIIRLPFIGGIKIQSNNKQFITDNDPKTRAMWENAIEELEKANLIKSKGYKRHVFEVTLKGYKIAELLNP
jgi:hypothetical protein